ncbi:CLUMA_CG019185, isoform A [Clunio marinus]|uniref:CLUMA_CG019185, isoform A n=1 Tax=Clunio marinus TaxID=568069 RepID=A0A1J1J4H7_9DIPT|nr:CLUMA_CG019185, isoform A [Clunio marinus]
MSSCPGYKIIRRKSTAQIYVHKLCYPSLICTLKVDPCIQGMIRLSLMEQAFIHVYMSFNVSRKGHNALPGMNDHTNHVVVHHPRKKYKNTKNKVKTAFHKVPGCMQIVFDSFVSISLYRFLFQSTLDIKLTHLKHQGTTLCWCLKMTREKREKKLRAANESVTMSCKIAFSCFGNAQELHVNLYCGAFRWLLLAMCITGFFYKASLLNFCKIAL